MKFSPRVAYQGVFQVHLDSSIPILGTSNLGAQIRKACEKKKKKTFVKVNIDISCKHFSFLTYQRSAQFLHETLDTLIETLRTFTVKLA